MFQKAALLAFALAFASPVLGTVSQWGQCGGTGYTGSTVCASPNVCTVISSGLSQCIAPDNTPLDANPFHKYNGQIYPSTTWPFEVQASGYNANSNYWNPVTYVTPLWLTDSSKLSALTTHLNAARYLGWAVPIVIYNLPNRNCATNAQPGEFANEDVGDSGYSDFIQQIYTVLQSYSDVPVIIILEPYSLSLAAAALAGSDLPACDVGVIYSYVDLAVETLSALSTVTIYLDGGNAAFLSDPDARSWLTFLVNMIWDGASHPASIRGLATNIGSYNAFDSTVPEAIFGNNPVYNELLYAEALAAELDMPPYFIVDTSRSGVQGIRAGLNDWCNVKNAGFGQRPVVSPIPGLRLIDALVWVKLGGESDGTSSTTSPNFDSACASADSTANAPEYGGFIKQYYTNLANDAVPSIL